MRLIDADALECDLFDADWALDNDEHMVQDIVAKQPTVDAVPAVHGRWSKLDKNDKLRMCSCCKHDFDNTCNYIDGEWLFCPNCGAKMDGA